MKSESLKEAKKAASRDSRIVEIKIYPDGWVPNKYKRPAPGERHVFKRRANGTWKMVATEQIDRKRSGGRGPAWVAMSETGGRIASA